MDAIANVPMWALVTGLLALMTAANECGFRLGRRYHRGEPEPARAVSTALKGSVFGLVALLLGFSFSMTASRHEARRKVVLDEANAVGTCYLRGGLLADPERARIRDALRGYVAVRLEHFEKGLDPEEYRRTSREMDRLLAEVWAAVEAATRKNPEAVRTSQIVPAANEVLDLSSTRAWATRNHLPAPVLVLLVTSVAVASLLMGHSSGQAGKRHTGLWAALNVLLVLVLFVVLDFDRPRRGLIRVDHTPLVKLKASFDGPPN